MALDQMTREWFKMRSRAVVDTSEKLFNNLLERVEQFVAVNSRAEVDRVIQEISAGTGIDVDTVDSVAGWINTVITLTIEIGAESSAAELGALIDTLPSAEDLRRKLKKVLAIVELKERHIRRCFQNRSSIIGVMPCYEDISATVELRAVLDSFSGGLGHLGKTGAKIIGLAPVASIRLTLDSGLPSEVMFQAGRTDLIRLHDSIGELLTMMDTVSSFGKADS